MKFTINSKKHSDDETLSLLPTQKLNDNTQWLKSIIPPEIMGKQFFESLYEKLKENSELRELIESIKYSIDQSLKNESKDNNIISSVYCNELSKTNEEFGNKLKQLETKLLDQVLKEIKHSYKDKQHTHSGFVYYLYYAWSNDMGICLRPDMIYYTIVCETINYLNKNKNIVGLLKKNYKINVSLNKEDYIDENLLFSILNEIFQDKSLCNILSHTEFSSQPDNFNIVLKFASMKMAKTEFNCFSPLCGITQVDITDNYLDWLQLLDKIKLLSTIIPTLQQYYDKCSDTIMKIISIVCDGNNLNDSDNQSDFFENIFWLENKCTSRHYIINGWFANFYMRQYTTLDEYPSHANYLPYTQYGKKYIYAVGMTYSNYENNILYPQYGEIVYQILHDGIFNVLLLADNTEITNEEKCKLMIKSINQNVGCSTTDEELNTLSNNVKQNNETTFVGKLMENITYATNTTSDTLKNNWQTTMLVSVFGVIGIGAMLITKLGKT